MPVAMKDRRANELKAKARAILDEILDDKKSMTADELVAKQAEMDALNKRADIIAGYTPDEEIADQGGDELLKKAAPEKDKEQPKSKSYSKRMDELCERVRDEFGGPNAFVRAIARRKDPEFVINERQKKVIAELVELQSRFINGTPNDPSGGEYLLPLQQVASIFTADISVGGIFDTARRYPVAGRSLRIPYLVQSDAANTRPMASIANVTIVGEGAEKPEREPSFDQRVLNVYKYAAYTEIADEMLADDFTGELAPTVQQAIGGQIVNKINEDITFDGTGSAMPLGAFNANNAAVYEVARATPNAFTVTDVFEMYARHVLGPSSRWYIHPSVVPQLMSLKLDDGPSLVTWLQSLQGAPGMQLMGLPVVITPLVGLLGERGDVALGNGAFYALALRQALTMESSIHYRFRHDITAYRFLARAGGIPIPDGTYSYKSDGTNKEYEVSPFVVLDDSTVS